MHCCLDPCSNPPLLIGPSIREHLTKNHFSARLSKLIDPSRQRCPIMANCRWSLDYNAQISHLGITHRRVDEFQESLLRVFAAMGYLSIHNIMFKCPFQGCKRKFNISIDNLLHHAIDHCHPHVSIL